VRLTERDSHFDFGKNWQDYATTVDQARIDAAVAGVQKLLPEGLAGKTFIDIGCGSGLHSLAALHLGAASVMAIDIDEDSVSTARQLLTRLAPNSQWDARAASVFDASTKELGTFDIVYSWGVLHHTGDMWRAIEAAARFVKPGGLFVIAIYAKTPFDPFWRIEKRIYSRAPAPIQWIARLGYVAAFAVANAVSGQNPIVHFRDYSKTRGMNVMNDVHDWLGGYPHETASAGEIREQIAALGFNEKLAFVLPETRGTFGMGCNEFVFQRPEV
jgi:SAM-dependent methyltransferase